MLWFCDCIQEVLINYAKCAVKMAVAPCLNIKYHINEALLVCIEFTAYFRFILKILGKLQRFTKLHSWLAHDEVTEHSHKMAPCCFPFGQSEPHSHIQAGLCKHATLTRVFTYFR